MPELPEVETARRHVERWMSGHRVVRTEAEAGGRLLSAADRSAFLLVTGRLTSTLRHGKFLGLVFGRAGTFLVHLGMTGKLVRRHTSDNERFSRARLNLSDSSVIHFCDARRFGRLEHLKENAFSQHPSVAKLGVDALEGNLTLSVVRAALLKTKQPLKVALLDQSKIAGFGNIHAAEALFRSGIHPSRTAQSLSAPEWKKLRRGLAQAIQFGLDEQARHEEPTYVEEKNVENPFLVYGRGGLPCFRCKTPIERVVQAARSTYFCSRCQPRSPP
jgi:formamidopyrimidine-DNA glycosylase